MKEFLWFGHFLYEASLALVSSMLILNVILLIRLRYSYELVTHMTERHYYISLTLLSVMFTYLVVYCYYTGVVYEGNLSAFEAHLLEPDSIFCRFMSIAYVLRQSLTLVWFSYRAHEKEALTVFANFQRMHRLETLIVEKDTFLRLEK